MSCCSTFCATTQRQFTARVAGRQLARYRRKGSDATTRMLRDLLTALSPTSRTLLDIGAGIGVLTCELLHAGFEHATAVDASSAYVACGREEAARRRSAGSVDWVEGDFVDLAPRLPLADVVTLGRVVCCYPAFEPLLTAALSRARHVVGLSYPRDRWYLRDVIALENGLRRLRGGTFRTFVQLAGQHDRHVENTWFSAGWPAHDCGVECRRVRQGRVVAHRGPMRRTDVQSISLRGLRLIGQGREAEIFEWRDGRVLKLLVAPGPKPGVALEIDALHAARSAGVSVPQAYEEVVIQGRTGLVMERLEGLDLLTIIGKKPWLVLRCRRLTGEIHARINAARAPASLPAVRDVVNRKLARLARSEPALAEWVGQILAQLPDGDALCHGDFHPGQLMFSDNRYAAFDWSGAKRGDALFDYARTRVLLSVGEPSPGTQLMLTLLAKIGRRVLLSSYARSYKRHTAQQIDEKRVCHWEIVNLAVRVDEVP